MKIFENYAILRGTDNASLVVDMGNSIGITTEAKTGSKQTVESGNKEIDFFFWGESNDTPQLLIENAFKNTVVASNLDFNGRMIYGSGVVPVRKEYDEKGEEKFIPIKKSEAPQIFEFLEDNNVALQMQELSHDIALLNNGFVKLIMNKTKTKILQMRYNEAAYSRLSVMNDKGAIEYHGYCADWKDTANNKVIATKLLDYDNPLYDLKQKMKEKGKEPSYVLHIAPPSPGKFYYQKAYWWSIFESHWYDFACAIPEFKMNLMKNQMVLKYHVQIRKGLFEDMYKAEGITDDAKKTARKKQFFQDMEDFLAGKENAGKNMVSEVDYNIVKGLEIQDIKITPIESFIKGGEYIEDSEEASNAICYAMGVHPSLQGASPGKNKTISGTEARELFIMKQSMTKPLRDILLQPLNIVKAINKWPEEIEFIIPNIMLTTLDKNTGAQKQIGNPIQ